MEDQLIKLHEEFVDKGMKRSAFYYMLGLISLSVSDKKYLKIITDKEIGYVLLDMQTWLREEHRINLFLSFCIESNKYSCTIISAESATDITYLIINLESKKSYNQALLSGLQEAIKLIE